MKSVYGFAGRAAFDRNYRAMRAAERDQHAPRPPGAGYGFAPVAGSVSAAVLITGPRIGGDERYPYPAELYFRDAESATRSEDWQGIGEDDDTAPVPCLAVTPHGEVLRKDVRYEGRAIGTFEVRLPQTPAAATLTNSAGTDGELTFPSDPDNLDAGDELTISWEGGSRTHVLVGAVVGHAAAVSGGAGDAYPPNGTAVIVTAHRAEERPVVFIDCSDAVEIIRTTTVRNPDGDYQGFVQEFDPATGWRDGEEVWVRNAN